MTMEEGKHGKKVNVRSIRMEDDTYDKIKALKDRREGSPSWEDLMSDLYTTYEKTTLETDEEFGAQIRQVNDLTVRVGEIFNSIVKQSKTKLELQEVEKGKLEEHYKEKLLEHDTKIKSLNDDIEEKTNQLVETTDK